MKHSSTNLKSMRLRKPSYQDGEWRVYPGDVTLKIMAGGKDDMPEPEDYHDQIRWRRLFYFLCFAVAFMTIVKLWVVS